MARETSRMRRVADQIQKELAEILQREASNLGFGLMATITEVKISPDFSYAKVFVSVLDEDKAVAVVKSLNDATKELRFDLARRMKLRTIPVLKFLYDDSAMRGAQMSSLIDKALKK